MAKFHAVVITTLLALFAQGVTAGPQLVKCSDCVNAGHTVRLSWNSLIELLSNMYYSVEGVLPAISLMMGHCFARERVSLVLVVPNSRRAELLLVVCRGTGSP